MSRPGSSQTAEHGDRHNVSKPQNSCAAERSQTQKVPTVWFQRHEPPGNAATSSDKHSSGCLGEGRQERGTTGGQEPLGVTGTRQ